MDSCNQKWFCLLPMRKMNRVNKGEVFLSKGRGTVKGNYGGSRIQHGEKNHNGKGLEEDWWGNDCKLWA